MEPMDVCDPDEEYIMKKAKSFLETDCFRCRSWLLTAKSMFPKNFKIHVRQCILIINIPFLYLEDL